MQVATTPTTGALDRPSPHLSPVDIGFLVACLRAEDRPRLAHALACPHCSEHLRAVLGFGRRPGAEPPHGRPGRLPSFPELWDRFTVRLDAAVPGLAAERAAAPVQLQQLLDLPSELRPARTPASLALICLLLEESYAASAENRTRAEELARLAVAAVAKLDLARTPVSLAADLNALAWALLGHAARLRGAHKSAESFFQNAQRRLALSVDPLVAAGFCRLLALLRHDESRQEEAAALAQRVAALVDEVAQPEPIPPSDQVPLFPESLSSSQET